jgi:hypothetical protein
VHDFTTGGLFQANQLIIELRDLATSVTRLAQRIERDPATFLLGGTRHGVEVK